MIEPLPMKLPSHDVLSRLARDDPHSFELLRHELIENRINRAPEKIRHRLRLLQFRVDGIRRRADGQSRADELFRFERRADCLYQVTGA